MPVIMFATDSPSPPPNVLVTPLSGAEIKGSLQPLPNLVGTLLKSYEVEYVARSGVFKGQKNKHWYDQCNACNLQNKL